MSFHLTPLFYPVAFKGKLSFTSSQNFRERVLATLEAGYPEVSFESLDESRISGWSLEVFEYDFELCPPKSRPGILSTANLLTKIQDFRGSDSSINLVLRRGILTSIGEFPGNVESTNNLSRQTGRSIPLGGACKQTHNKAYNTTVSQPVKTNPPGRRVLRHVRRALGGPAARTGGRGTPPASRPPDICADIPLIHVLDTYTCAYVIQHINTSLPLSLSQSLRVSISFTYLWLIQVSGAARQLPDTCGYHIGR